MKKIQVFLRHCYYSPNSSLDNRKRPDWFDKKKIFENFKKTINFKLADYTIIYDSKFGGIQDTFLKNEQNVEIINVGYESGSFLETIEIIKNRNFSDDTIIYFLEDDYLHRYNWCEIMLEGFTLPIHYLSLYDHLDKYTDNGYDNLRSKIYATSSAHWRTVPSTCNTYASKMSQLMQDIEIHKHFSENAIDGITMDHSKFCFLQNEGRILVTSIPGYSTHCDQYLSPVIKWSQYL